MTPVFEVPGDPGAVRGRAVEMRARGASFVKVADGLDAIRTDGWVSRSADMFRQQFSPEAGRWRDAGTGFVTAAAALEVYAGQLQTAQAAAAAAGTEWARGEQVTATARAGYDADVARGQREKAAFEAHGGTYTLTILPFQDPGEAVRAGAQQAYHDAVTTLDRQGHTCADQVRAGCAGAPKSRSWFETGLAFVGDVFVGIYEGVQGLAELANLPFTILGDLLGDLGKLATGELTAEELAMKYQLKAEDAQALFEAIKNDPAGFAKTVGKAVLDWDTWTDDPAKAIGHLIPDIVLAVATLGGGAAASGVEKGATGLAKGANGAQEAITAATKLDDVAGAASKLDEVTTVYRVEGAGNARLEIGPGGDVAIKGDNMLFLNFGDQARAAEFLQKRLAQGMDDSVIKSFDVAGAYADDVAGRAVPERFAKEPGSTIIQVDTARTLSSYGLRSSEFDQLLRSIITGSGR